jgi:diguanylate cyclase (GGDEF)-like protein
MASVSTGDKKALIIRIVLLLAVGFLAASMVSYYVSKASIRGAIIEQTLPLASESIYSEVRRSLINPITVSSSMSGDTFLRDWAIRGEADVRLITRYLREIRDRYNVTASFFISDHSRNYYYAGGVLRKVLEDEAGDEWYSRFRETKEPYSVCVAPDGANRDRMTIFIGHRMVDYQGGLLGLIGVGMTVDSVQEVLNDYQLRYQRDILLVDEHGKIVICSNMEGSCGESIYTTEGLAEQADVILTSGQGSYHYERDGRIHLLNVRHIPELKWFLFVEKVEDEAFVDIQNAMYVNIGICALISALVLFLVNLTINRYQLRLEQMATTDTLTGLLNRHLLDAVAQQAISGAKRSEKPVAAIIWDIDYFKTINDNLGHTVGDQVIRDITRIIRNNLRASDAVFRWGGEEFLAILRDCGLPDARAVAEKIRVYVQRLSFPMDNPSVKVTLSSGISITAGEDTPDALFSRADAALYRAKGLGRNRVCDETEND